MINTENASLLCFVFAFIFIVVAGILMRRQLLQKRERQRSIGERGENKASQLLDVNGGMDRLDHIVVGDKKNVKLMAEVDHIIKGRSRILIVETKSWRGKISGGPTDEKWIVEHNGRRTERRNPILQVQRQAQMLQRIHPDTPIQPFVLMVGWCEFVGDLPPELIMYKGAWLFQRILSEAGSEEVEQNVNEAWDRIIDDFYAPDYEAREALYREYATRFSDEKEKPWRVLFFSASAFLFLGAILKMTTWATIAP